MVIIGLDYGTKKTGIAVFREGLVLPVDSVFGSWGKILIRLGELATEYGDVSIVLGLPLSGAGKRTELCDEVEEFSRWLVKSGYRVELVDEAGSSAAAVQLLGGKDRKGHVDSMAACEILKRYLKLV